ncbi:MAG: PadR family transcriptional regulator [Deltaproteobacteria bacterium]|nr:PadR family transcriptional regulator [Deltaproteobacteria bacterium]
MESKKRGSGGGRATPVKASLELALLGLIAAAPRICGYDIVRIFNLSMRHFWHAHPGQIYPTLARMERAGWIGSRELIQRGRPNKRLFTIAPTGRDALERWLESPYENLKLKHAPLLKTLYLGHLGADRALAKFAEQRAGWLAYLEELRGIERDFFARGGYGSEHRMFSYFTLRYGIGFMEESLRWCDWAMEEIERNRNLFSADSGQPKQEQREFAPRATRA